MRLLPDGRVLALAVVKSIPSMFGMVVLTLVLLFVYQMIGWSLFGAALPDPGSCTLPARDRLRHRHSIDLRGDGHGPWDCRAVAAEGSTTR
jgi:hypothetical protein